MDAIDYEKQGYIKGASARIKTSNYEVIIMSDPKVDSADGTVKVWAAMGFDPYVRFLCSVDDLALVK